MKVYFVGYGLAHYFNDLLNKLQEYCGVKITVFTYSDVEKNIGEGVFQTYENIEFETIELETSSEPKSNYFPRLEVGKFKPPNYNYLKGLDEYIIEHKPDIIVASSAYMEMYLYNTNIQNAIKKSGTKLIFRTIPFQQPLFEELLLEESKKLEPLDLQSLPQLMSSIIRWLNIDKLYYNQVRKKTFLSKAYAARKLFNYPDAHACYVPQGTKVYKTYGVSSKNIHIMLNSPDTDKLLLNNQQVNADKSVIRDPYRIVHVGRLIDRKKVDLLLHALKEGKKRIPELNLTVIGNGPQKLALENLSKTLGLENSVTFRGGIYDPLELAKEMKQASVYVLAGMGGLSLNEAMCFELPIICSVCDGSEDYLVRNGENGFFFKEDDVNDLCSKIIQIISSPSLQNTMAQKSIEIIRNEINIHTVCDNYNNLFNSLVK